jgi:hypothetical protein
MSPDDIKEWLGEDRYMETPVKMYNGKAYVARMYRLKLRICGNALSLKNHWIEDAKEDAKNEINELKLTHLCSVRFHSSPIFYSDETFGYHSYVRGVKVINV